MKTSQKQPFRKSFFSIDEQMHIGRKNGFGKYHIWTGLSPAGFAGLGIGSQSNNPCECK